MLKILVKSGATFNIIATGYYQGLFLAFFLLIAILISLFSNSALASTKIISTRLWAGPEYTRLTLESNSPINYTLDTLDNPRKIIMNLEGVALTPALESLSGKVNKKDPFIQVARIERPKPHTLRLVLGLKTSVAPKTFTLDPMDGFGHRLVLDIYPPEEPAASNKKEDPLMTHGGEGNAARHPAAASNKKEDPLMALVQEFESRVPTKNNSHKQSGVLPTAFDRNPRKLSKTYIVAIDAGHGGKDPGAIGPNGTREKDVTLAIARKLKTSIDKEPNMRAVLIRDDDYFLPLEERRAKARRANADLFISVHADAVPRLQARGSSVYALSENGATSTTANWLAKKENESDLIGGVKLDNKDHYLKKTLIDLSLNATINDSIKLAGNVLSAISSINPLNKRNVEQAGFAVLKSPDIPSILVETAFISNPTEEEKLRSQAYQDKMANAITAGIKRYFAGSSVLAHTELVQAK
ncbi:N-acetylmuramoyl-L-alanine amidase [Nitrosomonas sp. Nm33]|uniref:N-acetylmuramoyl-L-alanine amidase n=1 Tax=Nitrosomonas sp. Nm33 TaxID=133724 RepID=UPI000897A997|nr:N-acetylmuramoyl-L-alanine amidase [Nitrosomonas sp. Nm33]SDY34377.1 N-acetylmuramoyl-L-alanine amidase [Nitrosomonas sp. Nm33]